MTGPSGEFERMIDAAHANRARMQDAQQANRTRAEQEFQLLREQAAAKIRLGKDAARVLTNRRVDTNLHLFSDVPSRGILGWVQRGGSPAEAIPGWELIEPMAATYSAKVEASGDAHNGLALTVAGAFCAYSMRRDTAVIDSWLSTPESFEYPHNLTGFENPATTNRAAVLQLNLRAIDYGLNKLIDIRSL